jgi:hypothetical protein
MHWSPRCRLMSTTASATCNASPRSCSALRRATNKHVARTSKPAAVACTPSDSSPAACVPVSHHRSKVRCRITQKYVGHYFLQEQLVHDVPNQEFVLTTTGGRQIHFNDFTVPTTIPRGRFKSISDPDNNATSVTSYTMDNKPAEVQRSTPVGQSPVVIESYQYSYLIRQRTLTQIA